MKIRKDEEYVEEEEIFEEENDNGQNGEEENNDDKKSVYVDEEVKSVPATIERIYSELDAIKDTLTQLAEVIRSSAEAQRAINEAMEKGFKKFEIALKEIAKIEMPEDVNREIERKRYVRPGEPTGVKPESIEEEAKDIVEPKRVAGYRMPDYLGGEDEKDIEKRAASVVVTPRPEADVRTAPVVSSDSVDVIKQILESGKPLSIEEVGEMIKKNYDVKKLV